MANYDAIKGEQFIPNQVNPDTGVLTQDVGPLQQHWETVFDKFSSMQKMPDGRLALHFDGLGGEELSKLIESIPLLRQLAASDQQPQSPIEPTFYIAPEHKDRVIGNCIHYCETNIRHNTRALVLDRDEQRTAKRNNTTHGYWLEIPRAASPEKLVKSLETLGMTPPNPPQVFEDPNEYRYLRVGNIPIDSAIGLLRLLNQQEVKSVEGLPDNQSQPEAKSTPSLSGGKPWVSGAKASRYNL